MLSFSKKRGLSTAVGDEGGFAPKFDGIEDALDSIIQAIKDAGYEPGKDVKIAMDCAASEFAVCEDGKWFYDYRQLKNGMPKDPNGKSLALMSRLLISSTLSQSILSTLSRMVSMRTTGRTGLS